MSKKIANSLVSTEDGEFHVAHRVVETNVWVTFDKVGFHRYPDAPEEVKYLRDMHRHVFMFKVEVTVHHDDREIEFHMFKNWLTSLYEGEMSVDHKSCEMLAEELLVKLLHKYNCTDRDIQITVSEDGECGATLFSPRSRLVALGKDFLGSLGVDQEALRTKRKEQVEPGREQA